LGAQLTLPSQEVPGTDWPPAPARPGGPHLRLQVTGFDVNYSATYSVYVTSTGALVGTFTGKPPYNGGDGSIREAFLEQTDLNNLTVKDSLGSTVTIPVAVVRPY
jgi:hypothetical protein